MLVRPSLNSIFSSFAQSLKAYLPIVFVFDGNFTSLIAVLWNAELPIVKLLCTSLNSTLDKLESFSNA